MFKKKAKKQEETKVEKKELSFVEEQKKVLEDKLRTLKPDSEEYAQVYDQYLKIQESEIKEETLSGKKIENHNKSLEPELKNKERKAGVAKTAISAGAGVAAAILIPLTEQKIGPAMSKLSNPAMSNIFKQK
jgi:hypothetical protein